MYPRFKNLQRTPLDAHRQEFENSYCHWKAHASPASLHLVTATLELYEVRRLVEKNNSHGVAVLSILLSTDPLEGRV